MLKSVIVQEGDIVVRKVIVEPEGEVEKGTPIKGKPGLSLVQTPKGKRWKKTTNKGREHVNTIQSVLKQHGIHTTINEHDVGADETPGYHVQGRSKGKSPHKTLNEVLKHLKGRGFVPEAGNRDDKPGKAWSGIHDAEGNWHSIGINHPDHERAKKRAAKFIESVMAKHGIRNTESVQDEDEMPEYGGSGHHVSGEVPSDTDHVAVHQKIMRELESKGFEPEPGNRDDDEQKAWQGVHDQNGYWHSVGVRKK